MAVQSPTSNYPYPSLPMDLIRVIAQTEYLIGREVSYELGAKAEPLSIDESLIHHLDCSGFVRLVIFHSANNLEIPDGSANQHQWCVEQKFKRSTFEDAHNKDNVIRIAFLTPEDGGGIGHVMLIVNGLTCESHGGRGVDRRSWGSESFMSKCSVYVLTL